jgi:hypothetical protein
VAAHYVWIRPIKAHPFGTGFSLVD